MKAGEHGNKEGAAVAGARAFAVLSELTDVPNESLPHIRFRGFIHDRGARSRPLRRWWSERGGTAKKLN
jgi:hypothetical protein